MDLAILIEKLPSFLVDFPEISLVYLFGSRVAGQIGPMSDYDLAILVDSGEDGYLTQAKFQHALVRLLDTDRVDVVLLEKAPIELAYNIIANGKLLYQKDTYTRVEYEARVMSQYGDYLPVLKPFREQILQGDVHAKRAQRYREAFRRTQRAIGSSRTP